MLKGIVLIDAESILLFFIIMELLYFTSTSGKSSLLINTPGPSVAAACIADASTKLVGASPDTTVLVSPVSSVILDAKLAASLSLK